MRWNKPTIGVARVMFITGFMAFVVAGCTSGITPDQHYEMGKLHLQEGNFDAAISEAREAIRQDPKHAKAYSLLCQALPATRDLATRDLDGAVAACRQALSLDPDIPGIHQFLAQAFDVKKDWKSAIPEYRAAISSEEKGTHERKENMRQIAYLHGQIGLDLMEIGDMAGAIEESVAEARAYPTRQGSMQRLLKGRGLLATTIANGKELVQSKPADAEAHHQLGSALEADEQLEFAAKEYAQACKLGPPESRYCADARWLSEKLHR